MKWVRLRSWHLVRGPVVDRAPLPPRVKAYCGKVGYAANTADEPPETARTCESCFRVRERTA